MMKIIEHSTVPQSFWQELEYRKRCLCELEQRNFEANHDYDTIFSRIDEELGNE